MVRGKDFTHMGINCVSGLNVMCVLPRRQYISFVFNLVLC